LPANQDIIMLNLSNYILQYSQVNFAQVLAAAPDVFITEAAPISGTPQLTNAQVQQLTQNGTQVFGYVDSCVTDDGRPYWNPAWTSDGTDKGTPTALAPAWLKTGVTNPFGITTDFRDPAWKQIVINQCVDLVQRGYSGIFLDDVAQYFNVGTVLGNTAAWARAMLDLVTDVKDAITAVNPNAQLIVNSTPYITNDALGDPTSAALIAEFNSKVDAMMLEVFFGISFPSDDVAIQQAINAVKPYMTVLALEYGGTPFQNQLFKTQSEQLGFVPGFSLDETYSSFGAPVQGATSGADVLQGTRRADVIDGLAGVDQLFGGDGNDVVYFDPADDLPNVRGGAGTDTLVFRGIAAPTTFSLTAHEFERAEGQYVDNGTNTWSSYKTIYTADWKLDFAEYLNDNGTRSEVDYDQIVTNTWQTIYRNFDAQNRLASEDYVFDNGNRGNVDYDETGLNSWSTIYRNYDSLGRLATEDYIYRNGTRGNVDYDETNDPANSWNIIYRNYDPQGRLATEDYILDNGRRTNVDYDETASNSWNYFYRNYDTQGRLDYEDVVFDNGTRTQADYDQAGQFGWSTIYRDYDALGNLIRTTVIPD
jgi:uncharacterized protein (TIGR01370 family)